MTKKSEVFPRDTEVVVWGLLQLELTGVRTRLTDKTQQAGRSGRLVSLCLSYSFSISSILNDLLSS